jgi:hypothetical protein
MIYKFVATVMVLGWLAAAVSAQEGPAPAEMQQLQFLVGRWRGSGWRMSADGARQAFEETEVVVPRTNGAALSLAGTGRSADASSFGRLVHSAFGLVSYDRNQKVFRWYAITSQGDHVDTQPTVGDRQLTWELAIPNAPRVRYTIRVNDQGQWFEIGETSSDGCSWQKIFEMTLDRARE